MITVPYSHAPEFIDILTRVYETGEFIAVTGATRAVIYARCAQSKLPLWVATDVQRGALIVHKPAHRPELKRRKR